jgi:hypothetical protein
VEVVVQEVLPVAVAPVAITHPVTGVLLALQVLASLVAGVEQVVVALLNPVDPVETGLFQVPEHL